MNQDSTWEAPRWRNATALFDNVPASSHSSRLPAPQLSAPTAVNPATQSSIVEQYSSPHAWIGKSRTEHHSRAFVHDAIAETSPYQSRPYERHISATSGDSYGAHQPVKSSPHETSTASWRSLHRDRRMSSSHTTDTPLTLHIPQAKDLPRVSSGNTTAPFESQAYNYSATPTTSLPSIASLKEHSATRNDDVDGPEIASMSSRLSCYLCVKLRPLVKDVADAVAELDETVRTFCNRPANAPPEIPSDSPVRAAQWILERLRSAKKEIQEATRRGQTDLIYQSSTGTAANHPPNASPSNTLKRLADGWDRDDLPGPKRPRSGNPSEQHWQFPPMGFPGRDERRLSIDFGARDSRPGYSPPPSDSIPGSAHPRHMSPTFIQRNARALPSPSSLVYPPSAAPSLPPPTAPSVGSPATSYLPTASIHSTSTNSVTSAHIADLQHQVTLKSLALQTLQSEYASLLQKLQRERVKSQTIEKKTSVADQEVNDLTSKNEELAEQIKALSTQLEECEKKREAERADAQREKDQWGRMLEMSSKLHAKVDAEKQRLAQEKDVLSHRLASYEDTQAMKDKTDGISNADADRRHHGPDSAVQAVQSSDPDASHRASISTTTASYGDLGATEALGLRREIQQLNARIDALRSALQQAQRNTREIQEQSQALIQRTSSAIETAIEIDDSSLKPNAEHNRMPSGRSTPTRQPPAWSPGVPNAPFQAPAPRPPPAKPTKPTTLDIYHAGGKITTADIATVARARSPGPEEMGISIQPTTSSPEELIRALGPVPSKTAPLPPFSFTPVSHHLNEHANIRHQTWRPQERFVGASTQLEHHIPAPSCDISGRLRLPGSSPHSYHSSPGAMVDDISSGSGSIVHSPEGYTSEPEASSRRFEGKPPPSLSELPRLHTSGIPSNQSPSQTNIRDSGYISGSVMLPPPRPGMSGYSPQPPL